MLSRRSLFLALGAGILAFWTLPKFPLKDFKDWYYRAFPRDLVLFVYDTSGSGVGLRNLELAYPAARQKHDGLHIIVQPIQESEITGSVSELLGVFGRTPNEPSSSRLFIRLSPPFRISKKQLHAQVDAQDRYKGEDRVRLLSRIVPIVGADERAPEGNTPCQQFDSDLAYATWTFGGFALRLDDQTFQLLRECLAGSVSTYLEQKQ